MPAISRRERLRRALDVAEPRIDSTESSIPADDTTAWREPQARHLAEVELIPDEVRAWDDAFHAWTQTACAWREHSWCGIAALHVSYCEWAAAHDADVCDRQTFEAALACLGFRIADATVYGLIFKTDMEAAEHWKNPPEPLPIKPTASPARRGDLLMPQHEAKRPGGRK